MFIKKRVFIRIVSYLSVAVIALLGFGFYNYSVQQNLKLGIMNDYSRSFADLSSHLYNIETAFDKSKYAATEYQAVRLASEIWRETGAAKTSLEQMPIYELNLEDVSTFLAQAGDYSYYIASRLLRGETLSDEEISNISSLADVAANLSTYINGIQSEIYSGNLTLEQVISLVEQKQSQSDSTDVADTGKDLVSSNEQVSEYPELIYDGPFSDHIEKAEPVFLKDAQDVTADQAKAKLAKWLGADESSIELAYETDSKVSAYVFNAGQLSAAVTKKGGYLLQMTSSETPGQATISPQQGISKAAEFLEMLGHNDMKESYYMVTGGEMTINFAYSQNGVTAYPDLIKVIVNLENGQICGYEAFGYIMAHREDRDTEVLISSSDALEAVSKNLTVESSSIAIIPTDGKNEVLCYEFVTTAADGRHILVYVNAKTGVEEMLQILIETEDGTLTV